MAGGNIGDAGLGRVGDAPEDAKAGIAAPFRALALDEGNADTCLVAANKLLGCYIRGSSSGIRGGDGLFR